MIRDGAALGAALLIAVVLAKILVFAVCEATGFIGGPFLVMLFIGGTAGVTGHVLIPGLPEGLAFAAMFAALPASLVAVPFSLLLLTALTTQIGTLQMAPVADRGAHGVPRRLRIQACSCPRRSCAASGGPKPGGRVPRTSGPMSAVDVAERLLVVAEGAVTAAVIRLG